MQKTDDSLRFLDSQWSAHCDHFDRASFCKIWNCNEIAKTLYLEIATEICVCYLYIYIYMRTNVYIKYYIACNFITIHSISYIQYNIFAFLSLFQFLRNKQLCTEDVVDAETIFGPGCYPFWVPSMMSVWSSIRYHHQAMIHVKVKEISMETQGTLLHLLPRCVSFTPVPPQSSQTYLWWQSHTFFWKKNTPENFGEKIQSSIIDHIPGQLESSLRT